MKTLLLTLVATLFAGCTSISGPCQVGPDRAACDTGGSMVILVKDVLPPRK